TLHNLALIERDQGRREPARQRLERAIQTARSALRTLPNHPGYRELLAESLVVVAPISLDLERPAEAAAAAREFASLRAGRRDNLHQAACLLARCAARARGDEATGYADEAMKTLLAATAAGYADGSSMAADEALVPLRGREDF